MAQPSAAAKFANSRGQVSFGINGTISNRLGKIRRSYRQRIHTPKVELFQISNDPEEAENQASPYPDRVAKMMDRLNAYAYDMMPLQYMGEPGADNSPVFWRENVPAR